MSALDFIRSFFSVCCWCVRIKSTLHNVEYLASWFACIHAYTRLEFWFLPAYGTGTPFHRCFTSIRYFFSFWKFLFFIANSVRWSRSKRKIQELSLKIPDFNFSHWTLDYIDIFLTLKIMRNDLKNIFAVADAYCYCYFDVFFLVQTHAHTYPY